MPMPVTIPILAHIYCTVASSGMLNNGTHSGWKPSDAPATAAVPMPLGSSSDAPEIRPGPRDL